MPKTFTFATLQFLMTVKQIQVLPIVYMQFSASRTRTSSQQVSSSSVLYRGSDDLKLGTGFSWDPTPTLLN